jgi:hypothetical protein
VKVVHAAQLLVQAEHAPGLDEVWVKPDGQVRIQVFKWSRRGLLHFIHLVGVASQREHDELQGSHLVDVEIEIPIGQVSTQLLPQSL